MNPLQELERLGQSVWLDFVSREILSTGGLKKLIAEDSLKGVTSNPSIFEKAIGHSADYDDQIHKLVDAGHSDAGSIFRELSVTDIRNACDVLRQVYEQSNGADGFVSIEVSPYLAMETDATITEARSLWKEVGRDNLMVKVPGTEAGIPAIRTLLSEGININITLLFARSMYAKVVEAFLSGLETLAKNGGDLKKIASVASFFVSRIDTKADDEIEAKLKTATGEARARLEGLKGKVAIANAKLAYRHYKEKFAGARWDALAAKGARPQRLLWASTSTKNKAYSDVMYVDELIGPNTVNTIPPETMEAYRDHGKPKLTLEKDVDEAKQALDDLAKAGISLDKITGDLVVDGVEKFAEAADKLYGAIAGKRTKFLGGKLLQFSQALGDAQSEVKDALTEWTGKGKLRQLWNRDKTLWTGVDEDKWLGWLDIVEREQKDESLFTSFAQSVKKEGWSDVVLLGMGGSSLGAQVFANCFGKQSGYPTLHVLDSTDPDQIGAVEKAVTMPRTLFIVSSKSGSTLEPNILKDYFHSRVAKAAGDANTGRHFVAITDPGSSLEKTAKQEEFAHIFHGDPPIGGRYSVLSKFGLVPAAAMGLDIAKLLASASQTIGSTSASTPPANNPGVQMGVALGVLATKHSRDKITIVASETLSSAGAWLEQLIAESTGKKGKGLIPVDAEPLTTPDAYGNDRVFVSLRLKDESERSELAALEKSGQPVIRIVLNDIYQIGQMFFLCEMAIAVAGAVIGIDPFDQPDVEASKVKTRDLMNEFEKKGSLPTEEPVLKFDGIMLYADADNAKALANAKTLPDAMRAHFARAGKGDYAALLAFIEMSEAHRTQLQTMRTAIRDWRHVATCAEFGPRFLHSTGQAYKGGPNSGVFLTITANPAHDLDVPGKKYSFGAVARAEAIGDFQVLCERKRRVLRVHLDDLENGLKVLRHALEDAAKSK